MYSIAATQPTTAEHPSNLFHFKYVFTMSVPEKTNEESVKLFVIEYNKKLNDPYPLVPTAPLEGAWQNDEQNEQNATKLLNFFNDVT